MICVPMPRKLLVLSLMVAVLTVGCFRRSSGSTVEKDAILHYRRGILAFEQKRYAESIAELKKAIRIEPENADFRMRLGLVHFAIGEWDKAQEALGETLRIDPYRSEARNMLGSVLFEKGERAAALEEFRKVLADPSYPTPEKVWVNIGKAYDQMGNAEEAVRSFRRALDVDSSYPRAHYELAQILDKMNRLEEAIAEYDVAAPHYDSLPAFHYRLGLACFRAGKKERARQHFELVVQKAPGSTDAARAEEYLQLIR